MPRSKPEAELERQLRALLPVHGWAYMEQYRWHPDREFRADVGIWSSPESARMGDKPLLVEIDGASRSAKLGAHQRAAGIDSDCRRSSEALLLGYTVLRVSAPMVYDGNALIVIERLLGKVEGRQ
ncbi:MAG: hypothetical protein OXC08_16410 [Thiotrichales bacterium]|nr:hypothetical protein [Thiotrichales bacterium]